MHRNSDDKAFVEYLSDYMKNNDDKVKQIQVKIDSFTCGLDSLDDVLIYSNYALSAFYNG